MTCIEAGKEINEAIGEPKEGLLPQISQMTQIMFDHGLSG